MWDLKGVLYSALISWFLLLNINSVNSVDTQKLSLEKKIKVQHKKEIKQIIKDKEKGKKRNLEWCVEKNLNNLYETISQDLKQRKPLIITSYLGLWYDGNVEKNLYWDWYGCSVKKMFKRALAKPSNYIERGGKRFKEMYQNYKWAEVFRQRHAQDIDSYNSESLIETAAYYQKIQPNNAWKNLGVNKDFDMYLVFKIYRQTTKGMTDATMDLRKHVKQNKAKQIKLNNKKILDLKQSQIIGYIGHNVFYGCPDDLVIYELEPIIEKPKKPKGVFSISCESANFGFIDALVDENTYIVAFTTSRMAPEAYNIMALADSISQCSNAKEIANKCNKIYKIYHKGAGNLFVNHGYKLFKK